jgi:hypothetical protein
MLDKVLNVVPIFTFVSCSVNARIGRFIAMAGLPHSERRVELRNDFDGKAYLLF